MDPSSDAFPHLIHFRKIPKSPISGSKYRVNGISGKKVPARNAPVVVLAGSSGNARMSLPKLKMEETPRMHL